MKERPDTKPRRAILGVALLALASFVAFAACSPADRTDVKGGDSVTAAMAAPCAGSNDSLSLPPGFCATVFADSIGHARHLVVAPNGDVYVNTWNSPYYGNAPVPVGGFLVALRDTNSDGTSDVVERFGDTPAAGGTGGTGIALHGGALYAETGKNLVRYAITSAGLAPAGAPDTVVSDLPGSGDHPMHPLAIDSSGSLYVDVGSATNSCQVKNRTLESPGQKPCRELATRAGIWRFDANKLKQKFSPAERYVTGLRNAVGISLGPDGSVWATQHGRDQLADNWPTLYTTSQGQELPAEELLQLEKGADYGWPECYYDGTQRALVLAPEYGGDGGKALGNCASKRGPTAVYPAHWAPDGLLFYSGKQLPVRYRDGVFIVFHGSWNRAPGPQGGYKIVFQPMTSGKPSGDFETFADGFAGATVEPDRAAHRPVGIAQAPDGALYVTDDKGGRIWRITYQGAP